MRFTYQVITLITGDNSGDNITFSICAHIMRNPALPKAAALNSRLPWHPWPLGRPWRPACRLRLAGPVRMAHLSVLSSARPSRPACWASKPQRNAAACVWRATEDILLLPMIPACAVHKHGRGQHPSRRDSAQAHLDSSCAWGLGGGWMGGLAESLAADGEQHIDRAARAEGRRERY